MTQVAIATWTRAVILQTGVPRLVLPSLSMPPHLAAKLNFVTDSGELAYLGAIAWVPCSKHVSLVAEADAGAESLALLSALNKGRSTR